MTTAPLVFRWFEGVLVPLPRFARQAHQQYQVDQTYFMGEIEERSDASHNHQFAWLKDAWLSLPEHLTDEYPTQDHLRRHALIKSGFFVETVLDCGANPAALRVAATMRSDDTFALVVVRGPIVVRRVAKSQSRRTMDRAEFQASKEGMMAVIAEMIGVEPEQLSAGMDSVRSNAAETASA